MPTQAQGAFSGLPVPVVLYVALVGLNPPVGRKIYPFGLGARSVNSLSHMVTKL